MYVVALFVFFYARERVIDDVVAVVDMAASLQCDVCAAEVGGRFRGGHVP